jgi:hypothetical protein
MRPFVIAAVVAVLLLACFLAPLVTAAGGYHEDKRLGYKIRPPQGWTTIPIPSDQEWIASKFMSDKVYRFTDKADGSTYQHKPELTVIAFISEIVKKRGVEAAESEGGGIVISFNNPFKNYKDYLKRTYGGGGWFVDKEEEKTINGISVTCMEIKVDKLSRGGPRRIFAWVYHTPEVDFAVQIEVLENSLKKTRGLATSALKSFKIIPRTEGSLSPATTGGGKVKIFDEGKMSPAERKAHRLQLQKREHDKAIEALPKGWKTKKIGRFLVLNHLSDNFKYAKKLVAHADAVWCWLDKNFEYVGKGEYVREPILRICCDRAEESSFLRAIGGSMGIEIVTHKDPNAGAGSWEFEYVNQRFMRMWFRDRDRELYWAIPPWFDVGLEQVLGTARSKGKKLIFKPDSYEKDWLREAVKADNLTPPGDLMKMIASDYRQNKYRSVEAWGLVRFFIAGAASKSRKTKTILQDYLKNLRDVITEIEKEEDAKRGKEGEKEAETEEEEEARLKARADGWKEKQKHILDETFRRTFGTWSESDWRSFDNVYYKAIG